MKKLSLLLFFLLSAALLCASQQGLASWYTCDRPDALTANGEIFDSSALTAAHRDLTFGTIVRVTSSSNGKSIEVRINDRGPYVAGRIIDLTPEGARQLGFYEEGITPVTVEVISTPAQPESEYVRGEETGWYTVQIGSYTNTANAWTVYENIRSAGLKPTAEIISDSMLRISVGNVQAYRLQSVLDSLAGIGIQEPLVRGARSPYL